jgi:uncharacterized protein (TIGR03437 family)
MKWIIALTIFVSLPVASWAQADRIAGRVDATRLAKLSGNVKPLARPEFDQGPVDAGMKLNYVRMVFKPSPAQQAALDQLLRDQQTPRSANYRKWLSPEQFADRFGLSQADIDKVTSWMRSQGFDVVTVARGRRFIAFNATVQQVQTALKTEIHHYRVNGEMHFANSIAPSVPEAIQPLVLGFMGLDDFGPKAQARFKPSAPNYTQTIGSYAVTPADLAVIYDLLPIYEKYSVTGDGWPLAVMGQSEISLTDIDAFQSDFGLPSNEPKLILVPGTNTPGFVTGDQGESDLDVEYAGGIAPTAEILFVYSPSVVTSVMYAIDQAVAPVISYSYAACEPNLNSSDAAEFQSLAQQANAEGITWVVAAGDDGAAMCDTAQPASKGLAVSIEAAVPEITGVGGSMFSINNANYWSNENNPNGSSALQYIPETVWNESTQPGNTHLSAGGGGYSIFFQRPTWQTGPGTNGSARGVPDVSFTSGVYDDPYVVIESGQTQLVGGTSAATPVFAGILTLLNDFIGGNGLGNINPNLYYMAQTTTGVFHDITTGGNLVPCAEGSPDCGSDGMLGYLAGPGWDPASGWGSVDAYAMFNNWSIAGAAPVIGAVVNGASFTNTGLSPGLIFTILGTGLGPVNGASLELDNGNVSTYNSGIEVSVDGTLAPLLYVGPGQINAVAPYELTGSLGRTVSVQVFDGLSQESNEFSVQVVATAPAIFSLGNGQGAILNQNGSVNGASNPAAPGSYIQIYATGEGQTNPPGVDGAINNESAAYLPVPVGSVSVSIGGVTVPADAIAYAGAAPQSFAGFFQVDVQIPTSLKAGNQPVVLTVGGASSPPLNVAVQ